MGNGEDLSPRALAIPNPNTGTFKLEWSAVEANQVVIYNSMGQMIVKQLITQEETEIQFDLSSMSGGIYRVVIYGNKGQVTLPVVLRH
jgi:hypothetical protein